MANRTLNRPRALEKELVALPFQFALDTSAAVVAASLLGRGFTSVAKTSTGLYVLTLQDPWVALIGGNVSILAANAATQAIFAQFGDFNMLAAQSSAAAVGVASAASIALQTVNVRTTNSSGAVADCSVACKVVGCLYIRNSTVV